MSSDRIGRRYQWAKDLCFAAQNEGPTLRLWESDLVDNMLLRLLDYGPRTFVTEAEINALNRIEQKLRGAGRIN